MHSSNQTYIIFPFITMHFCSFFQYNLRIVKFLLPSVNTDPDSESALKITLEYLILPTGFNWST